MRRGIVIAGVLVGMAVGVRLAHGDERTATAATGAPRPGEESGRVDREYDDTGAAEMLGRGLLFVPRAALEIAFAPVRGGAWVYERYQLGERWKQIFFTDDETVGLYPTLLFDSGYGLSFGGRFVHRDVLGKRENLGVRAGAGGRYRQLYTADLRSGDRFGERVGAQLRGELERRPQDRFYGIGNSATAVEARHRQQLARISAIVDVRVVRALHVRASGALTDLAYGPSETGTSIEMAYDPAGLTGFMRGVRNAYGELELTWDSRRPREPWDPQHLPSTGWLVTGYAGPVVQLREGSSYWRTGAALQRFIWLGRGPRVLALRLQAEAVTGDYADVAFTELPQLGGRMLLRGYPIDRFRDRAAGLGSIEYRWDLNANIAASLFVDAGRVMPSLTAPTVDELRVGYGLGVQIVTDKAYVGQLSLASSRDGGLFVNFALDPTYDVDPRVVRR
jgi:hypothetical protein